VLASGLPSTHSVEPDYLQDFSWSPDGTLIAFVSGSEAGNTLSTVDVATGELTTLVKDDFGISAPAWRPEIIEEPSPTIASGCHDVDPPCIERLPGHVLTGGER